MSVDPKIIDRVEKLLRLAGPSTNSDHERASAALEAARLFNEHQLVITTKEARKRSSRPRKPSTPAPSSWAAPVVATPFTAKPGWCKSVAARDSVCVDPDCQQEILKGDPVWMRMDAFRVEYIHVNGPCGW